MELGLDPLRGFFAFFKSDGRVCPASFSPTLGIILPDYVRRPLFILVIATHRGLAWDRDTTVQCPVQTPNALSHNLQECLGIALPKIAPLTHPTNPI